MNGHAVPRRIVVISDFQGGEEFASHLPGVDEYRDRWLAQRPTEPLDDNDPSHVVVEGGYLERLPLACIKAGLVDKAEIWSHWRDDNCPMPATDNAGFITRLQFQTNGPELPFCSNDMLGYIKAVGPPDILCVWGLGVAEDILQACETSFKIYNSIDAPALRVPPSVSRHFDLVLTGAEWQSREVRQRHPGMKTMVLPIGPEFAADTQFYPTGDRKIYDIIYVAAAQAYKRHDVLFNAMAKLPRDLRALCVSGYGEMAEELRAMARDLGIDVEFIGPPGVSFGEVNALMNKARLGVVCGVDDGAPAIITEYMLAGLPVLANADLRCGLQYITPKTGQAWSAEHFHEGLSHMLANLSTFTPRDIAIRNWTWPNSICRLKAAIDRAG